MPLKRRGPLQLAQREVEEIKKQVNIISCYLIFQADELAPVGNYDQRKQEEERRVQNILERLNTLSMELSPPGPSTEDSVEEDDNDDDEDDSDEEDVENDSSDDEDERRDVKPPSQSDPRIYVVLSDFKGEQEGDLSVRKGEVLRIIRKTADGWWLAQDTKGSRGVVPKTYLKVQKLNFNFLVFFVDRATHFHWCTVKKALTEIDATDVLSAMGAIPSGFRPSTLNKLLVEEGVTYRGSHYIQPQLSQSQLSFKDLFLDPDTGKVRARQVNTSVCFTLWGCRMIPTPGVGVQVLSRHIRLCAFDGTQVLSNIHVVRAAYNAKSPKTWSFSPRVTGILPTLLDGDCFLRCDSTSPNLGILFELGVTFIRNSTGERGDLSCGWAFLKLTDDAGNPLPNRTYELPVNGGTPYEKDVTQDMKDYQMLQARRQPKLIVKLKSANSRMQTQLSLLPDNLLHCLNCIHLLVLHRQLLADALLMDRPTMQNADLMCSPVLSTFPKLLDQPDLLDALRSAWLDAETNMNRAQKRDLSYRKLEFVKVYMSSVYFLLHSPSLSCHRWADPPSEAQRARVIYATLETLKNHQLTFDLLRLAR
uniref:Nephronophthisis 1 n=1 Tax=Amphilophus citrinellus TaxID=61819 RepID=A0A3Q0S2E8_AMPCI